MFGSDIGTGARAVIHDDGGAAQLARQRIAQRACREVAGAAGRKANHKPDRPTCGPDSAGLRGGVLGWGEDERRGKEGSAVKHSCSPGAGLGRFLGLDRDQN